MLYFVLRGFFIKFMENFYYEKAMPGFQHFLHQNKLVFFLRFYLFDLRV